MSFFFLSCFVKCVYIPSYDKYGLKLGDTGGGTGKVRYAAEPICCGPPEEEEEEKAAYLIRNLVLDTFYLASTHSS